MKSAHYLKVAVPTPLRALFDYLLPPECPVSPLAGMRVRVPFGAREAVGFIVGTAAKTEVPKEKLKPVKAIIDREPVLDRESLAFYLWAGEYYQFPAGQALQASLPKPVRAGKELVPPRLRRGTGRQSAGSTGAAREPPPALNPDQAEAVKRITATLGTFHCHLLEGITGSGKTEVYLHVIAQVLEQGRQALALVPEIGLTPQTVRRFEERFGRPAAVLHSGLSDNERFDAWLRARNGGAGIVIGTRSAIFTPLARLGLIVIDEEHDASYKQQDGFRYSARDLGIVRASRQNVPVLLGSATPSLESLRNALGGRYSLHSLGSRAGAARPPRYRFIDVRGEILEEGFSAVLLSEIAWHLEKGNQVLVFLNRRGYSPILRCHDCGWIATCPRCETAFTVHRSPPGLHCHRCDSQKPLPGGCPDCPGALLPVGMGTERSESMLENRFPQVPIHRIDSDSTRARHALEDKIDKIHGGAPCILVGTQMLAKGHHFPGVTLAAILDADSGLFSADFRGQERMGQLLTQVAGRAGRGGDPGEVLIQTHHASHPALRTLVEDGYGVFARRLLEERRRAGLPPFSHLALIRAEAHRRGPPETLLATIGKTAGAGVAVLGPMPSPMEKRAGKFRFQLLLQSTERSRLHRHVRVLVEQLERHPLGRKVRWSVDIDPMDLS